MKSPTESIIGGSYIADVGIPIGRACLEGELNIPAGAVGIVAFAHGSGSSRHSSRNQFVAQTIREAGVGTLLFDLLTVDEERKDSSTGQYRFDINLLGLRLVQAAEWLKKQPEAENQPLGFFGSSTGGAAALVAAAELGAKVGAVVSRGGRPDLAGAALPRVQSPTLFLVGEYDREVMRLNEDAFAKLQCEKELTSIPRATHLFEEEGALDEVARLAAAWFQTHLRAAWRTLDET